MKTKLSVLGVCGAQGALLFPFRKQLLANIEPRPIFHTKNEEQWKLNFKDIPFLRSLEQYNGPNPDIILGSPSCGHSSVFSYSRKKRLGNPKEDKTLNLFVESILKFKPKVFLLENLPKLMDVIPQKDWEKTLPGYNIITHCHSVIDFGNSQKSRKRLILIGARINSRISIENFLNIFQVTTPRLVSEILEKVRNDYNFREEPNKVLSMYHYDDKSKTNLSVEQVQNLWNMEFKNEYRWPMKNHKMVTLPGVYRNQLNSYPLTIRPANRQFNPDGSIIGLEDTRIIMGFPKKFKVYFDPNNRTYWLNKGRNTLAKGSVYEVGVWFKKCLGMATKTRA